MGAANAVWYAFLTQPLRTLATKFKDPEAHHPARFSCDIYSYFGLGICGLIFRRLLPTSNKTMNNSQRGIRVKSVS